MSVPKEKTEDERKKMRLSRFLLTGNKRPNVQNTKICDLIIPLSHKYILFFCVRSK